MPMFSADVLPDVTGRVLGAADKQWDVFIRNLVVSGTVSGQGLNAGNLQNAVADTDTFNAASDQTNSGNPANLVSRIRVSNPSAGPVVTYFKNQAINFGGIAAADSPSVSLSWFCNAGEPTSNSALAIYQRGSNTVQAVNIDLMGRINSYANGYINYAFQVAHWTDANPFFMIGAAGELSWGSGGNNGLDVQLYRSGVSAMTLGNGSGTARSTLLARQFISDIPTGTAPFVVASSTVVASLNADMLDGADWTAPPTIGSVTPGNGTFASLSANGQLSANLNDGVTPPLVVPSIVPVPNLTVTRLDTPTINGAVNNDGGGIKHIRVAIPSIAASASLALTVTWTTPFSTPSYTVVAGVFDPQNPAALGIRLVRKTGQAAGTVTFLLTNDDTTAAHATGVLHVIAIRG